jgi:hypothetical protein
MHTFSSVNMKGTDQADDCRKDCRIILEWILGIQGWDLWIGFIWLRITTWGGFLLRR